jgi:hypothetical protein
MRTDVTFGKVLEGALNYFVEVVLRMCDHKQGILRNYIHPFGFWRDSSVHLKKMDTRLRILNVRNLNRSRKQKTVAI